MNHTVKRDIVPGKGLPIVAMIAGLIAGMPASAGPLTGQSLSWSGLPALTPATAVVGGGIEFIDTVIDATDGVVFDFNEDGLLRVYLQRSVAASHSYGPGFNLTFFDTNATIADIVGFTLLSVDPGITGVSQSDLSFTANQVSFVMDGTDWPGGAQPGVATFQINFASAPEPSTLALLGLAVGGFFWRRRGA